jgi:hypothetical protein
MAVVPAGGGLHRERQLSDGVDLGTVGIHGNGHMMMLEKNELEIAAFMAGWLQDNIEKGIKAPATR